MAKQCTGTLSLILHCKFKTPSNSVPPEYLAIKYTVFNTPAGGSDVNSQRNQIHVERGQRLVNLSRQMSAC